MQVLIQFVSHGEEAVKKLLLGKLVVRARCRHGDALLLRGNSPHPRYQIGL